MTSTHSRSRPAPRRALLVEDDEGVRRSLQLLLHGRGFEVRSYASAVPLLQSDQERDADVLVADYQLPDKNGIAVLRDLRARGWQGRSVLITAFPSQALIQEAQGIGFHAVLEKPLQHHLLMAALA
ncbi:response regulator [Sphingomonas gellani]|uniref:response regulator n=1 Tax=Sphingomonas gellani TaxID=1166340 RepID=UPI001FCD9764|nr:response regulator [Sphingomonas gellani]